MPVRNQYIDLLLYTSIGLLVVLAALLSPTHVPPKFKIIEDKWGDLVVGTGLVFGFLARAYWHHRRSIKLWALLGFLFLLHLIVFRWVLPSIEHWSLVGRVAVFTGELMFLCSIVYWILRIPPEPNR